MRLLPRSLFGRMLAISTLTTIAALAFAALSIGHVLERFVIRGLDQQLDAEIAMLARAVQPDGTLDQARVVNLPVFDEPGEGWGWSAQSPRGRWTGGDVIDAPLSPTPPRRPPGEHGRERPGPRPGDGIAASGERVHSRELTMATNAGVVTVTASGPRRVALAPLREAMIPLLGSLAILALALAVATAAQLQFGLRPLRTLRAALAEVRAGQARHIPSGQPDELAPLATELNALIDQNEAQLEHARRHVSNLAHGLKTPLAALSVRLAESGRDPDGSLGAMVAEIDGRVRHHLGRARAAAPGGGKRVRAMLAPAIADLITVMQGIHAERAISVSTEIVPDLVVAVDHQDLEEMLGNLLDNAWRHAHSAVAVMAAKIGSGVEIAIEDDGPGLSENAIGEALIPGRRLDERGDGHGFGLSIAQELAELSGGRLVLGRSVSRGGLCAVLTLPASLAGQRA